MLSKKVKEYLEENEIPLLNEFQEANKKYLIANGYDEQSSFFEFMVQYSDEMLGSEGHLSDVIGDLMDYGEDSFNYLMHQDGVPEHFISLTDETDLVYLLYNKENGEVVLIEGADPDKLLKGKYDRHWNNFNEFLEEFFEIEN